MTGGIEVAVGSDSRGMPVLHLLPLADPTTMLTSHRGNPGPAGTRLQRPERTMCLRTEREHYRSLLWRRDFCFLEDGDHGTCCQPAADRERLGANCWLQEKPF